MMIHSPSVPPPPPAPPALRQYFEQLQSYYTQLMDYHQQELVRVDAALASINLFLQGDAKTSVSGQTPEITLPPESTAASMPQSTSDGRETMSKAVSPPDVTPPSPPPQTKTRTTPTRKTLGKKGVATKGNKRQALRLPESERLRKAGDLRLAILDVLKESGRKMRPRDIFDILYPPKTYAHFSEEEKKALLKSNSPTIKAIYDRLISGAKNPDKSGWKRPDDEPPGNALYIAVDSRQS